MKKFLVYFLAIILTASLFASGGQQAVSGAASQTSGAYSSMVTEPGKFPVVTQPVTLKVFAHQPTAIENFETNTFTKFYEQKSGVKLVWQVAPSASLIELRRLSIASGDLPDFYINTGFTRDDEVLYGKEKVFIPLNNLVDQYGLHIKDMFKDIPESRSFIVTPDGNIYGLPQVTDGVHALFNSKLYVNTAWMKTLNLKTPNTINEYTEVLRAFKSRDPNGNGKADELPLIGYQPPASTEANPIILFFANSYIHMDPNGFNVSRDNKVDVAYNKPEFRQALTYLNSLVTEGLLDPSSFSMTQAQMRQIAEDPSAMRLGTTVMQAPSTIYAMTSQRQRDLDAIPPLAGPAGVRLGAYHPTAQINIGQLNITSACKYPEVVIRWDDWFFSLEGLLTMRIGRENIEWAWAKPGELSYTGVPAKWVNIGSQGGSTNEFWMQYSVASYNRHSLQRGASQAEYYGPEGLNTRLYDYTKNFYMPYKPANHLPPMYFEANVLEPIVQPLNDIISYRNQMWARFITGDLTLNDANWNSYVNTLNQMGVANVIKAYQTTYDTFLKNTGK